MRKLLTSIVVAGAFFAISTGAAFAASPTVGNPAISRANVDTYSNFTIIDANSPVSAAGFLTVFQYYAANTNPFEFVLVNSSDVVQWVSPVITPSSVGVQTYTLTSPVDVQAGWNLGAHFDDTGTIPFDYVGSPASYTPNNDGMPYDGETLSIQGTSDRMYSWNAGTLAPAAAPCAITGAPFLEITRSITNDPDSGNHGNWATDAFTENVDVWLGTDNTTYCARALTNNGTFVTTGPLSPEQGVALSAGITGTFTGGENYILDFPLGAGYTSGTTASPEVTTLPASNTDGFSAWVATVFPSAPLPGADYTDGYSLTYLTQNNGDWTDADGAPGSGSGGDQGDITGSPVTYTVTIDKYLDNKMATASSAKNAAFPMVSSWNAVNLGAGSGSYTLSTSGFNSSNPYEAITSPMDTGASYQTNEVTTGNTVVGTSCSGKIQTELVGYSWGSSKAAAQSAKVSKTAPSFTNLTSNEYVIVWNKTCPSSNITVTNTNSATVINTTSSSASTGGNISFGGSGGSGGNASSGSNANGGTGGSAGNASSGKATSNATSVNIVNFNFTKN